MSKSAFIYLLLLSLCQQHLKAQCTMPVNTFPYNESFENNNGNWVSGGNASSWKWGTPSKRVIIAAGGGNNCWITAGLKNPGYSNAERSWLQSPCFDLTTLKNPQISFKVFWETEKKYDGAGFQYSANGGTTWITLGSINSNSTCQGINWFNYSPVNFLYGEPGWSGNIQSTSGSCLGGGGSNGWVTARHNLAIVAGMPNVIFRFTFGAGLTCNNYDGFAIDDINISEGTPAGASFTYTCSATNTVTFTGNEAICQTGVSWNFGDPSSGSNNVSSVTNPTHTFSVPGTYRVSYTANYTTAPSSTSTNDITVIQVTPAITNTIKCSGDATGAIAVNVNGGNGAFNYSWSNSAMQNTPAINNLQAGTYTVTVTSANTCSTNATVILPEPEALSVNATTVSARCGKSNGNISSIVTGGTIPYTYKWSSGLNQAVINNASPGNYSLIVTDANGCIASANNIIVTNVNSISNLSIGNDTTLCLGKIITLFPGAFSTYRWQDNSTSSTYTVSATGTYFVKVTDDDGCIGSDTIKVKVGCPEIFFPSGFTPNRDSRNEGFGPLGDVEALRNYKMIVYSRFGQLVFSSTDPFKKWDGRIKNKDFDTEVFVWFASYSINNDSLQFKKGTVTVIH